MCSTYVDIRCAANLADVLGMLIVLIGVVVEVVDRGAELGIKTESNRGWGLNMEKIAFGA
jgi:hypothetical protein